MALPRYKDILSFQRSEPCQEYPGEWLVCIPESLGLYWTRFWFSKQRPHLGNSFQTFDEAMAIANSFITYLENSPVIFNPREISICWKASDNDPRIGKCWFTPFYMHGRFTMFGEYRKT